MNARIRCVVIGGMAVALLSACTSMQEREAYVAPERTPSLMDPDDLYVARVESIARRRGIHVTWVNVPTRRPRGTSETPK